MKKSQAFASRKLTLNRETIAPLTDDELEGAAGGYSAQSVTLPPKTHFCGTQPTQLCGIKTLNCAPKPPTTTTTTWSRSMVSILK